MTRVRQPEGEIFGRRLRELREKHGVTQNALATASGLTEAYISNMENGFAVPSLTTVLRLAAAPAGVSRDGPNGRMGAGLGCLR